ALSDVDGLYVPAVPAHVRHAFYRLYVYIDPERLRAGWNQDRVIEAISREGVPCMHGSCSEIYREKAFEAYWKSSERLPIARQLGETSIALFVHPTLGDAEMQQAISAVRKVMQVAVAR
ncbi:MAG TPA: DegT/DnrJ/EryC1/StrS family aminotransferase, partial [Mariprofundaceae bacterium]|nr:DegT/DnrJ/EryC1/StrS family aminotransferase [Mariprofundaceae bacterium]